MAAGKGKKGRRKLHEYFEISLLLLLLALFLKASGLGASGMSQAGNLKASAGSAAGASSSAVSGSQGGSKSSEGSSGASGGSGGGQEGSESSEGGSSGGGGQGGSSGGGGSNSSQALTTSAPVANSADFTLITEPENGIAPIDQLISSAHTSLEMVMYELSDTHAEQLLSEDAAHGVKVRVLLDSGFTGGEVNKAAYTYLQAHGVEVRWTPSYFTITHQKTIIVDNNVAAIMTLNLTPQYYKSSRDFALLDRQPADVAGATQAFENDWSANGEKSAGSGTDLVFSPGSESAIISVINKADHTLWVENEEMDYAPVEEALEAAAHRGVAVNVVMTESSSWSSAFTKLANAGVHVSVYAEKAPLYIHAKIVVADETSFFLGSENFSSTSLKKNRELGVVLSSPTIAKDLVKVASADAAAAKPWG